MMTLFFTLLNFPASAALRIVIDPGHGGYDKGAIHNKVYESDLALQISRHLSKYLQNNPSFTALLLRSSDMDLKLQTRVKKAKTFRADLFVSIHVNSNPNSNFKGIEFYIQNQMPSEEENLFLANRENSNSHHNHLRTSDSKRPAGNLESILYDLKKTQRILESYNLSWHMDQQIPKKRRSSKIRQGPFYVLSQSDIPAVLVEVGYLSNSKERKKLLTPKYQKKIARQIYQGLLEYRKNMDKSPAPALQHSKQKL